MLYRYFILFFSLCENIHLYGNVGKDVFSISFLRFFENACFCTPSYLCLPLLL